MDKMLTYVLTCIVLSAFLAVGRSTAPRRPFRSAKAPKETVMNYEVVTPRILFKGDQAYPKVMRVLIPTNDYEYTLVLELNEVVLSSGFTSRHYDQQGKEVMTKGHVNCFYQGWVEGHPEWKVAMSTCHGLQGSFGDATNKSSFFHLEPLSDKGGSLEQLHAFYLDSEYEEKQGSCGSNHSHVIDEHIHSSTSLDLNTRLRRQSATTLFVEWVIVSDYRQYAANGFSLSSTVMRALALANEVDTLYQVLNIRIILIEAITWTNGDLMFVSSDADTLLDTFRDQQRDLIPIPYDSAMLLTGIDLDGTIVGIAFRGNAMCSPTRSVGVTQDGGESFSFVATIAAHEIGHTFDMGHDFPECVCADENQACIMGATLYRSRPPTRWSSCSIIFLNEGFSTYHTDRCLSNIPTTTAGDPVCGDRIREGDEICDCGSEQECTDPCCNAATCQLASGAQCSAGPCCSSTCQFLSYGTECRVAIGECDIAEYCPGDSGDCPSDDHQLDGTSCSSDTGYCISGMCPTHDAQCQVVFGSTKSAEICYSYVNTIGEYYGNCGHTTSDFIPCSNENVQCGQLQCMYGDWMLDSLFAIPVYIASVTVGSDMCRSFTSFPTANIDIENPGLVEDGTRCGDGKVCFSQQCQPLSTNTKCYPASNGRICFGNGVCNNRGLCACDVGYTGTNCDIPYSGP